MSGTPSYKLLAYNTSFANDAHWTQLHPGLSESASIVAKAIDIYGVEKVTSDTKFTDLEEEFKNPKYKVDPVGDGEQYDEPMKQKLGYLRMGMADAATEYIQKSLDSTDFVALIEQMIHVPDNHQAYYGAGLAKSNLDVVYPTYVGGVRPTSEDILGKNKVFGILRRIQKLGVVDIDGFGYEGYTPTKQTHTIVYDNIANTDADGVGEGIAIIVKNDTTGELFKWNKQDLENVKLGNDSKKSPNGFKKLVHYYSDDFGRVVSQFENAKGDKPRLVKKGDGVLDLGRPIIMTVGIKNDVLNVFVAAHGVNIFNLTYLDDNFYGTSDKYTPELKSSVKDNKNLEKLGLSNNDGLKKQIYDAVYTQLGAFINKGLSAVSNETLQNIVPIISRVNLFLGGDFNDPNGEILKRLVSGKIEVKFNNKKYNVEIKTNLDKTTPSLGKFSCCGNRDSQNKENRNYSGFKDVTNIGNFEDKSNIDQTLGSLEVSFSRNFYVHDKKQDGSYPESFHRPESFGYNGDYALFGIGFLEDNKNSITEDSIVYDTIVDDTANTAKLDSTKFSNGDKIIASDHLPVYATVAAASAGGGRRRVSPRRKTRKGLMKLKKSRRH